MNFFDAQQQAHRFTRWLVAVYLLATMLIVLAVVMVVAAGAYLQLDDYSRPGVSYTQYLLDSIELPLTVGLFTVLLIAGASLFKLNRLRSGGGRVAEELGGTLVAHRPKDPMQQRLRNVVEEMAIASGVPVPDIYVLEQEQGINAFAAGFAPEDAAVAVTRGSLLTLNRDELQGVVGHEFSHILNGDMRLNMRLMGVLYGILVLGILGLKIAYGCGRGILEELRLIVWLGPLAILGLLIYLIGSIGVFFARLIKAGVSRQREFLADASAVQFTRQTDGLVGALKKIGGYEAHSYIRKTEAEEVSHMLFGTGSRHSNLFATHPPLDERIQALDPSFRPGDYPAVSATVQAAAAGAEEVAGIAAASAAPAASMSPDSVVASVGQPNGEQVLLARQLRAAIPASLDDAARSVELAYLLPLALILDQDEQKAARQLSLLANQLGDQRTKLVKTYYREISAIGPQFRLPLLEIAFPALRRRSKDELDFLIDLTQRLIDVDGEVELYEYCFARVLVSSLAHVMKPTRKPKKQKASRQAVRDAAVDLLRIVAMHGHRDSADAATAFRQGLSVFGDWAANEPFVTGGDVNAAVLDAHLDLLTGLNAGGRQILIKAIIAVIMFDGKLTLPEAELTRAICASLRCPLPPILLEEPVI